MSWQRQKESKLRDQICYRLQKPTKVISAPENTFPNMLDTEVDSNAFCEIAGALTLPLEFYLMADQQM